MKIIQATSGDAPPKSTSRTTAALFVAALVVLGAFVLVAPYAPAALQAGSDIFSQLASSISQNTQTTGGSTVTEHSYNPLIQNGSANVKFPSDYAALQAYALSIINQDRANFSLPPVTLSSNQAGQQHADSMLNYGYFSHFDTQGFKPYMRYSLLGGVGADAENVAFIQDPSRHFGSGSGPAEQAMSQLEFAMMYNDSACCNNGHRENILSPLHNKVSIGVAYDTTHIYFDEEFENDYANLNLSVSSTNVVTLIGPTTDSTVTGKVSAIFIAYDQTPQAETVDQLNSGPHEYDPGSIIGGILPPCSIGCSKFQSGVTVYAKTWTFSNSEVDVVFSIQDFINLKGQGVYTIYMVTGSDTNSAITSISVFVA